MGKTPDIKSRSNLQSMKKELLQLAKASLRLDALLKTLTDKEKKLAYKYADELDEKYGLSKLDF